MQTEVKPAVNTLSTVRRLNHINRCSRFRLVRPTTVAEHSFHVVMLTLYIAEELTIERLANRQPRLDIEKAMRRALLHDVEEALMSDIPHDVKRHLPTAVMDKALDSMVGVELKTAPPWFLGILLAPCDGSLEHTIAKLADHLELAQYCAEEVRMGNKELSFMLRKAIQLSHALNETVKSQAADHIMEECAKYVTD